MHWLDFVLLLVLGIGGLLGLRSGLLWQVARVAIFVGAIYACIHYHDQVAKELLTSLEGLNEPTSRMMAYGVIFLGVCVVGSLITWLLENMLKAANLKPVDRLLGAVVGVLKTSLLCGGILTGMALYGSKETQQSMADSRVAPQLLEGMQWVLAAVPQKIKDDLGEAISRIKKTAADRTREIDRPPSK